MLLLLVVVVVVPAPGGALSAANFPWSDPHLPPSARAELLLKAMSLKEKVAYLGGGGYLHGDLYSGGNAPIPRLGVPQLNMNDGRAGYRVLPAPAPAPPTTAAARWPGMLLSPLPATPQFINASGAAAAAQCASRCAAMNAAANATACKAWVATAVGGCALAGAPPPGFRQSQSLCYLLPSFPTAMEHSDCAVSGVMAGAPRGGPSAYDGVRLNGGALTPGTSTLMPSGLTAAATWDTDLLYEWGRAMGREVRAKGAGMFLCPAVSVIRLPQGGRAGESIAGEDPVLGKHHTRAAVAGIQSNGVIANPNTYLLNNVEDTRWWGSQEADERTIMELYLPPFEGAVQAEAGSTMCS